MNIMFMGTPDFAAESLKMLLEKGYTVSSVVCQPDKPQGRKQIMTPPPVKTLAQEHGIEVYQPAKLKNGELKETLEKTKPDIIVVVAYGKLLPEYVLEYPKYGCINLHGSLLPKYRGSAPIQWTVINGDEYAGVTTMYMEKELDSGDIIDTFKTKVKDGETSGELFERLAVSGAELLCSTLEKIANGTAQSVKQNHSDATYAPMLNKDMAKISFDKTTAEIYNLIRGLNPWPVAYLNTNKGMLKIYEARVREDITSSLPAGSVIPDKKAFLIKTKDGVLELLSVQLQGKKTASGSDFIRGNTVAVIKEEN